MSDEDLKRRIESLERQREEDRRMILDLREDISDLVAVMRESNVYAKECYKRIEKGEAHRAQQDKTISTLGDTVLRNQPAVDSVNRIKVGLLGLVFTVMGGLIINFFVASNPPVRDKDYQMLVEELRDLRKHKIEDHTQIPQ